MNRLLLCFCSKVSLLRRMPLVWFATVAGDMATVAGKFAAVAVFIAAVGGKQIRKQNPG